ncbi:MAG: lipid-A-disaccharide synthase [Cyanobacteriota bacterium]|nr:lipid-A-disaccharide synthase [Cyanobacteriota bacterium]
MANSPHLLVCTGEISGDLQASYLIQALLRRDPHLRITAVGGERMAAAGATLLQKTTAISSIGIVEALPFIGPALWVEWRIRRFLARDRPDLCVLVDYIGVNSRLSSVLQRQGIPAIYYIAPQEWIWTTSSRISFQLAERMRLMLAIFPQEAEFYEAAGGNVRWVGHPLLDILSAAPDRLQARQHLGIPADQMAVMLFPASRNQELRHVAPVIFAAARLLQQQLPQVKFWLPLAAERFAPPLLKLAKQQEIEITLLKPQGSREHQTILAAADLIVAKSGTVNLESAILGIPQVVVYRVSRLTYWIGKTILNFSIPFMSPPNLVQMRLIVPELFQEEAQPSRIAEEALALLTNPQRRQQMQQDYQQMRLALGEPGVLDRAASEILRVLASC